MVPLGKRRFKIRAPVCRIWAYGDAMTRLNRQVVLWSHDLGTIAIPTPDDSREAGSADAAGSTASGSPAPREEARELSSARFSGVYPEGTQVENVVDIGEHDRVRCTIGGQRVTIVTWVLSDEPDEETAPPDSMLRNSTSQRGFIEDAAMTDDRAERREA